jgi:hypothetical protein
MRKFLEHGQSMALEAQAFGENISMEEEQILLDEAAQDSASVDTDLGEAERIIEVSDALEDLAVIADGIEEATPAEIALIENAGDMAVAGSDVEPADLVPAMESYRGKRIATEGIRETAQQIWRAIQDFLKNIWKKIEGFFYKIFGTIPALRKRLKELKGRVEAKSGSAIEDKKVTLNSGLGALSVDYKVVKNEAELKSALGDLEKATAWVYGDNQAELAKMGNSIADAISDFDPEKAEESAKKVQSAVSKHSPGALPGSKASGGSRFPGFKVTQGSALLGNVSLLKKEFNSSTETGTLATLDRQRRSGVELAATGEKHKDAPASSDFQTMSNSSMEEAIKICEKILDHMEDFQRGKKSTDVKAAKTKVENASKKATSAVEKAANDEDAKHCVPYYRAVLNFNASYARWAQSPAMPLASNALTTIRSTMNVIQKSLGAYKA